MGCIYRRNKIYWVKYYRNGKPYCESSHSDIEAVAQRLLKRREGEIAQGKQPGVVYDRISFDELADDYLTDFRINKKRSIIRAEHSVKTLREWFGGMKVTQITTTEIRRYVEKRLEEGYANGTINCELAALKRVFNLGAECTPPKVSQVPHIPMLREDNVRKGFFEPESFDLVMEYLPEYLRPVVFFGYCTGWRKEEILSLTWKQIDLAQGIVRLEPGETKNSEGRTIYMEPDLWVEMKKLLGQRKIGCPYVFNAFGKKIGDFRKSWKAACKRAGIPGMLFHDLRRTAVRNMIRAGIPERVAMAISGHKTRAVFDRYNIVSSEDLKAAALRRQEYREKQLERLQNGYKRPINEQRVVTLRATTP
ncbi:MAG TPA: site-specific integrase [Syntrophorhabdus sp.]|nr:site-specific integrase [Syntrophorhabdus sp.]